MKVQIIALIVGCLLSISAANAATVTYLLNLDTAGPGTFEVAARVSEGDNFGLASYGMELGGSILTLDNKATQGAVLGAAGFGSDPLGFSAFRSADNALSLPLSGVQDITNPNAVLLRGFGQTAGSAQAQAEALGRTFQGAESGTWEVPAILASGTYTVGGTLPSILETANLGATVFSAATGIESATADVVIGAIPEPTTIAMAGMGLIGMIGVARRRKS